MELTPKEEKITRLALDKAATEGERAAAAFKLIESFRSRGVTVEDLQYKPADGMIGEESNDCTNPESDDPQRKDPQPQSVDPQPQSASGWKNLLWIGFSTIVIVLFIVAGIDYISHPKGEPEPISPAAERQQLEADKANTRWMYDSRGNYINEEAERVAIAEKAVMYRDGIEAYDREVARQAKLHGMR